MVNACFGQFQIQDFAVLQRFNLKAQYTINEYNELIL